MREPLRTTVTVDYDTSTVFVEGATDEVLTFASRGKGRGFYVSDVLMLLETVLRAVEPTGTTLQKVDEGRTRVLAEW